MGADAAGAAVLMSGTVTPACSPTSPGDADIGEPLAGCCLSVGAGLQGSGDACGKLTGLTTPLADATISVISQKRRSARPSQASVSSLKLRDPADANADSDLGKR